MKSSKAVYAKSFMSKGLIKATLMAGIVCSTLLSTVAGAIASEWELPWAAGTSSTLSRGPLSNHRDGYIGNGQSVDFRLPTGTPVLAPIDSVVVSSCTPGNEHRAIKLRASTGEEYSLLHVRASASAVQTGRRYLQGEQIGVIAGDTPSGNNCANSTGPHLHMGLPRVPFIVGGYTFRANETLSGSLVSTNGDSNSDIGNLSFSGNVSSSLSMTGETIDYRISADNIPGKTVYVQLWRPAHAGYPERVWNTRLTANSRSLTFRDLDGPGATFAGVSYYAVASLNPLEGTSEAKRQRTSCFSDTGGAQLCDRVRR